MFYNNLIKIGKNILLLSSLGLALNSCTTREERYKQLQFYSDLNNDDYPEHIYFVNGDSYRDLSGNAASMHALVAYNPKKPDDLPRLIQQFEELPKDIDFVDVDGDRNIDFIYTTYYGTEIMYGNGDGTFSRPNVKITKGKVV